MTKKHLQFCIYYMQVGDPQVAYKMTYPRAAVKSLKASVSRLMARPDVAEWVKGTEERVHHRMMRQFYSEHYDQLKEKLLTINEKRTVLTKIITGETKRIRYVQAKYGVQKIEEDQPVYAVLRAIDLDTRLENFYNYLTRSDTWRKAQNIYVNTPTLQQQVNILISQTAEEEDPKNTDVGIESHQIPSPPGRACPAAAGGAGSQSAEAGWVHSRREEIPPLKEVAHERVTEDVRSRRTDNTSPEQTLSPAGGGVTAVTGVEHSHRTDNTMPEQTLSPAAVCLPRPPVPSHSGFRGPDNFGSGDDPARLSRAIRDAGTGVEHSRGEIPPCKEVPHEHGAEDVHSRRTDTEEQALSPAGGGVTPVTGVEHSRGTLAPKKIITKLTTVNKPLTTPCQSTTYKPPIFPTVKPHQPPPHL